MRSYSLVFLLFIAGCSGAGSRFSTAGAESCVPGALGQLKLRLTSDTTTSDRFVVRDSFSQTFAAEGFDSCGTPLGPIAPDSWSVTGEAGAIANPITDTADVHFTKGANTMTLSAKKAGASGAATVEVQWSFLDIPDLLRWYRADSFFPASDGTPVGIPAVSAMKDFNNTASSYDSLAATNREPRYFSTAFASPTLQFCGQSAGCTGITATSHLRVASSYAAFADKDFTIFYVVARANNNVNYLLCNQSVGNNTGTFMGFTSGTNFKLGLNGPGGAPAINASVAAYSGTPKLEIWTARLDTTAGSTEPGLRLYRNGQLVASDSTVAAKPATATTIPYLGTHRSDNANSQFHFGEFLYYTRGLSAAERCRVHKLLDQKYNLSLGISCP